MYKYCTFSIISLPLEIWFDKLLHQIARACTDLYANLNLFKATVIPNSKSISSQPTYTQRIQT
jgi:hypothetical protein